MTLKVDTGSTMDTVIADAGKMSKSTERLSKMLESYDLATKDDASVSSESEHLIHSAKNSTGTNITDSTLASLDDMEKDFKDFVQKNRTKNKLPTVMNNNNIRSIEEGDQIVDGPSSKTNQNAPMLPSLPKFVTRASMITDESGGRNSLQRELKELELLELQSSKLAAGNEDTRHKYKHFSLHGEEEETTSTRANNLEESAEQEQLKKLAVRENQETPVQNHVLNHHNYQESIDLKSVDFNFNSDPTVKNSRTSSYNSSIANLMSPSTAGFMQKSTLQKDKRITSNLSLKSSNINAKEVEHLETIEDDVTNESFERDIQDINNTHESELQYQNDPTLGDISYFSGNEDAESQYSNDEEINDAASTMSNFIQPLDQEKSEHHTDPSTPSKVKVNETQNTVYAVPPRSSNRPKSKTFLASVPNILLTNETSDISVSPAVQHTANERIITPISLHSTKSDAYYSVSSYKPSSDATNTTMKAKELQQTNEEEDVADNNTEDEYITRPLPILPDEYKIVDVNVPEEDILAPPKKLDQITSLDVDEEFMDSTIVTENHMTAPATPPRPANRDKKKATPKKTPKKTSSNKTKKKRSRNLNTLSQLTESSKNSETGQEFAQFGMQKEEQVALDKLVESLSKLTADMMLDPDRFEEGLKRLKRATKALEGF